MPHSCIIQDDSVSILSGVMQFNKLRSAAMRKCIQSISMLLVMTTAALPMYASADDNSIDSAHAVFVMSNAADLNEILAYARATDGSLRERHRFSTGGRWSGGNHDPLESAGSLTLSQDHSLLFAVNAGSGDISCSGFSGPHFYCRTKFYQRAVNRTQLHNTEILFTWSTQAEAAVSQGFIWKEIICAISRTHSLFSVPILPVRRLYLLALTVSSSLSRSV